MSTTDPRSWVPIRWPKTWNSDQQLSLLEGAPINCILDAPAPVVSAARSRGLNAVSKEEASKSVAFLADPVWPSVKMARRGEGAEGGPTGAPWVDANGWSIQLARALAPDKPVWVDEGPPQAAVLDDRNYLLAVSEPAAFGGVWVANLDEGYAGKLAAGDSASLERWRKMMDAAKFFAAHHAWANQEVCSNLAVISDFAGGNEFLAKEFLNLASRRNLSYKIWPRDKAARADTSSTQSILYVDEQAPSAELERHLTAFVRGGGMLIARKLAHFTNWTATPAPTAIPGYEFRSAGKGKLIMPSAPWEDPWVMAQEVRMIVGRRADTIRLYNAGIMGAYYTRSKEGGSGVLHLVNYTRRPAVTPISVAVADSYSTARMVSPESADLKPLQIINQGGPFPEMLIPGFSVYSAVELGR